MRRTIWRHACRTWGRNGARRRDTLFRSAEMKRGRKGDPYRGDLRHHPPMHDTIAVPELLARVPLFPTAPWVVCLMQIRDALVATICAHESGRCSTFRPTPTVPSEPVRHGVRQIVKPNAGAGQVTNDSPWISHSKAKPVWPFPMNERYENYGDDTNYYGSSNLSRIVNSDNLSHAKALKQILPGGTRFGCRR